MAKPAVSVVAVAGGLLLQGIASAEPPCMDLSGTWYSHTMEGRTIQPMEIVQKECNYTVSVKDMVLNGTAELSNATLVVPGGEVGHITSVASDGLEISWSWGDTWQRDCPGGLEGQYLEDGSDKPVLITQRRCNLSNTLSDEDGLFKMAGIGKDLGIYELGKAGKLVSKDLFTWDGRSFKRLRATPCLDYSMFEPEAVVDGHCSGDETNDHSKQEWCLSMGCDWEDEHRDDLCHCSSQKLCEGNGFTWEWRTCSLYQMSFNHQYGLDFGGIHGAWFGRAELGGAVTGVYDRCVADEDFFHSMTHMSNACCSDKMSVCDVRGQPKPTPCFDPAEFDHEAVVDGHCVGDETSDPARESECHRMGCSWDRHDLHDRCHCHEQALCERNNFTWEARTCADHASWLHIPGLYRYHMTEHGNVTGAMDKCTHEPHFLGWMKHLGHACCRDRMSVCDVGGQPKPTPCFDPADFHGDATLDGHCVGDETTQESDECLRMGCHWALNFTEPGDRCHCHDQALCERNHFTWVFRTCADHVHESGIPHIPGLYHYPMTEYGNVTGAMDTCMHDVGFRHFVEWMKEPCCGGKPSICDVGGAPAPHGPSKCIKLPARSYTHLAAKGVTVAHCALMP